MRNMTCQASKNGDLSEGKSEDKSWSQILTILTGKQLFI